MTKAKSRSVPEIDGDIAALQRFAAAYRQYLSRSLAGSASPDSDHGERSRLWHLLPPASRAMTHSGVQLTISPPPVTGGPVLTSFASQILAHEQAPYLDYFLVDGELPNTARMVLNRIDAALGQLADQRAQAAASPPPVRRTVDTAATAVHAEQADGSRGSGRPTLFGRAKALPGPVALIADLITIGLFVSLVVGLLIATDAGSRRAKTTPKPAIPSPTAPAAGSNASPSLTGTLSAYDASFGRKWATTIKMDITDQLQFRLTLHNSAAKATPSLVVEPLWIRPDAGSGPATVLVAAGPYLQASVVPGAKASLDPQSREGVGTLRFDSDSMTARVDGAPTRQLAPVGSYNSAFTDPTGTVTAAQPGLLGSLPPDGTATVMFSAVPSMSDLAEPDPFEFGGNTVAFKHALYGRPLQAGVAADGARLFVRVMLYVPGGLPVTPFVQVSLVQHRARGFVEVSASASVYGDKPQQLGHAIVNSASGGAISLEVLPGSTALYGFPGHTCQHIVRLNGLPDGIAQGGIQTGPVGGYLPRDPCDAREWPRYVVFEVAVRSA